MKTMKKLASLLLALAMIFSLATTAFAADKNDSITVNDAKVGETYSAYKMFDLKVNSETEPTAYVYTVNSDWAAFFGEGGAGKGYITVDANGYVTEIINGKTGAADLAKAAAEWATENATAFTTDTVGEDESTAVLSGLDDGYWLITSTLGTFAMTETTPDKKAVEINEKNPVNNITKEVEEDSTNDWGVNNDAQIGDVVNFKSTITLNKGTVNVKVTDTMESGLTYNKGTATFSSLDKNGNYTITETDNGFVIEFTETYLASLNGTVDLVLTYDATLNKDAIVLKDGKPEINPQTNNIKLEYGANQKIEKNTETTTHFFSVHKHAAGKTENLAGAVFSLKKGETFVKLIKIDDTNYRVAKAGEDGAVDTFTTVASGNIVIWGGDADDDYALEEITPPEGYNKLAEDVAVEVSADNSFVADVENKTGTELPSTGGMGTTLFYVVGGILVAAAAVLLVTKKRMAN